MSLEAPGSRRDTSARSLRGSADRPRPGVSRSAPRRSHDHSHFAEQVHRHSHTHSHGEFGRREFAQLQAHVLPTIPLRRGPTFHQRQFERLVPGSRRLRMGALGLDQLISEVVKRNSVEDLPVTRFDGVLIEQVRPARVNRECSSPLPAHRAAMGIPCSVHDQVRQPA